MDREATLGWCRRLGPRGANSLLEEGVPRSAARCKGLHRAPCYSAPRDRSSLGPSQLIRYFRIGAKAAAVCRAREPATSGDPPVGRYNRAGAVATTELEPAGGARWRSALKVGRSAAL